MNVQSRLAKEQAVNEAQALRNQCEELYRAATQPGQWEEAIRHFRRAIELDPGHPEARLGLAVSLELSGDLEQAREELLKTLEQEPTNARLAHYIAQVSYRLGQFDEAAQWLERYLSFNPRDVNGYLELAALRMEQGRSKEAIQLLERPLEFHGVEELPAELWLTLGTLYQQFGRFEEAEGAFRKAFQLNPEDPQIYNSLGYLYAEWGIRLEEAEGLIHQALALDPDNGAYLDSLGWVYFKMGRFKEAEALLEDASTRLPDSEVFEHLGQVYLSLGNPKAAKAAFEQASRLRQKAKGIQPLYRKDR
jgi:Flp pilus assembly protein TadD